MLIRRLFVKLTALLLVAIAAASCRHIDLKAAIDVTDVRSGWYDGGIVGGETHMLPSLTFRLHNKSGASVNAVQVMVSFWHSGGDGEFDSVLVKGISSTALPSGASTDPIVVRGNVGYTLEGARADFFTHSLFRDAIAKVFAMRGGDIVPMGEFKLDRILLMHELPK
jgi:hypothetical protein